MKNLQLDKLLYLVSRATGLVAKPVIILLMMQYSTTAKAYEISQIFFIVSAIFVVHNNEAYKKFYEIKFKDNKSDGYKEKVEYCKYLEQSILHWLLFSVVTFVFSYVVFHLSLINSACIMLLTIVEKIWDEMQRYALYSSNYIRWSILFLYKTTALIVAVSIYYQNEDLSFGFLYVITYIIASILAGAAFITGSTELLRLFNIKRFEIAIEEYKKNYIVNYLSAQVGAFVSVNIGVVDKWIMQILLVDKLTFVGVTLLSQIGGVFIVVIDNLFMAFDRDKYIRSNELKDVISFRNVVFVAIFFIMAIYLFLYEWNPFGVDLNLSIDVVISVLLIYVFMGLTRIPAEYVFWRVPRYRLTIIDAASLVTMFSSGVILYIYGGVLWMYMGMFLVIFIRASMYFIISTRV